MDDSEPPPPSDAVDEDRTADDGDVARPGAWSGGRLITRSRLIAGALALVALWYVFNLLDVWVGSTADYQGDASAAVVLGAAQYNGSPSAALQGRLDTAARLYTDGRVELVVVTGGGQEADITTEAKTGYDYLRQEASVPDEDLRLEVDGTSTYQSLAAVARFLSAEDIDRVILVTDPYHARRSQLIAHEVGLDAEVVSTEAGVGFDRLIQESIATSIGRILGFRRVDAYIAG